MQLYTIFQFNTYQNGYTFKFYKKYVIHKARLVCFSINLAYKKNGSHKKLHVKLLWVIQNRAKRTSFWSRFFKRDVTKNRKKNDLACTVKDSLNVFKKKVFTFVQIEKKNLDHNQGFSTY